MFAFLIHLIFRMSIVFISSLVFHELGHLLVFKVYKAKAEVRFSHDKKKWYLKTIGYPNHAKWTKKKDRYLYVGGIISGLIPIIIFTLHNIMYVSLLPAYIYGCTEDIKGILNGR